MSGTCLIRVLYVFQYVLNKSEQQMLVLLQKAQKFSAATKVCFFMVIISITTLKEANKCRLESASGCFGKKILPQKFHKRLDCLFIEGLVVITPLAFTTVQLKFFIQQKFHIYF